MANGTTTPAPPTGTATFLFTDIEGSTKLVQQLGLEPWRAVLDDHNRLLREAWERNRGYEVKTEGDAFFVAFQSAADAVAACAYGQRALGAFAWPEGATIRVRMGMHTGEAALVGGDYVGFDIHRTARVAATGHGGQVVISDTTRVLVEGALPDGTRLRDLGQHRLKDLVRPETLWQLDIDGLPTDFPALKSLDFTPNNLPVQLTSFIGREAELEEASRLLGGARLLTLTGPGGTGKTRLSLQLAAEASLDFPGGVYFVPLAPLTDAELVVPTIAQTLGLQVSGTMTPTEVVIGYLGDRSVLLVLDNFEQVLGAGAEIAELLRRAGGLKAIVSSRSPLKVSGEQEYPVRPLGVPDPAHLPPLASLAQYEAVALFIERALAVKPDFSVTNENAPAVAGITELVDGLPLAIELAAARIRLLPPQAMLERLRTQLAALGGGGRDLPARQQTLRGAIAWSYDMLDEGIRRLMDRFSVFSRGARLSHVEAVCGPADELGVDVLDGLEVLLEQNLLRTLEGEAEPRFLMLHVIREFALEKLMQGPDGTDIRKRHAATYLALAEEAGPNLEGADQKTWLDALESDHDNLRGALGWLLETDNGADAMRLASAIWRFWQIRGHLREGRQRIDEVLALASSLSDENRLYRLRATEAAGGVAWWQGDLGACIAFYEDALALAREVGSERDVANALYNATFPLMQDREDLERMAHAEQFLVEAEQLFKALGDEPGAARVIWGRANLYGMRADYEASLELAETATAMFRRLEARFDLIWALHSMAVAAIPLGKLDKARSAVNEALHLSSDARDLSGLAILLDDISDLEAAEGHGIRAVQLHAASAAMADRTGAGLNETAVLTQFREQKIVGLSDEEIQAGIAAGAAMSVDEAIAYALEEDEP